MGPGAPCDDAPIRCRGQADWLLRRLGSAFTLLHFGDDAEALGALAGGPIPVRTVLVRRAGNAAAQDGVLDLEEDGLVSERFDARPGTTYLLRPDQHVCARWRSFDPARVQAALARATANA